MIRCGERVYIWFCGLGVVVNINRTTEIAWVQLDGWPEWRHIPLENLTAVTIEEQEAHRG